MLKHLKWQYPVAILFAVLAIVLVVVGTLADTANAKGKPSISIQVLPFNEGEDLTIHSIREITWRATPRSLIKAVDIHIRPPATMCDRSGGSIWLFCLGPHIALSIPNTGKFYWVVGETSMGKLLAGDWIIQISEPGTLSSGLLGSRNEDGVFGESAPFELVVPTLALLSPNGGEEWATGTTQTITWEAPRAITGLTMQLQQQNCSGCAIVIVGLTNSTRNDGKFEWAIPDKFTAGKTWKLVITGWLRSMPFSDTSDTPFSIMGAEPPPPP